MIHWLLIWGCVGALLPCMITAQGLFARPGVPLWKRAGAGILCGPSMWVILLSAFILAVGASVVSTFRLRRAKKAKP
jgi:hypothetical protein